ncbi:MAG: DegT/DnrJ/EryC1/StrS family aminotransferase [Bdellovibrionaceae bacterium]|nr:DegT/DnrJ/EryC1/StrS family aminotransferase [Pseudobdellovibrionaceae bacterium]
MTIPFFSLKQQYNDIQEQVQARMNKVFEHGMFVNGPEVNEAEVVLANFVGCKQAIVCTNGTLALYLALLASNIGSDDEVIVPAFSFIATAEVIHLVGATPVYIDIDLDTYNMDVNQLKQALSPKTKAIIPVSLFGQTCDMNTINDFARTNNLTVIEDGAQSFGASYFEKKSCNLSDIGCTSFFPAKPLGVYGDGGAIFTNNNELASKLRLLRSHGEASRYTHTVIGTNARLNTLQCAFLLAKIERYPWEIQKRNQIAEIYTNAFSKLSQIKVPKVKKGYQSVWAQYTIAVENRDLIREKLQEVGVPTAVHYPTPMCDQPGYLNKGRVISNINSRLASQHVLSLPIYADMPKQDIDFVVENIVKLFT